MEYLFVYFYCFFLQLLAVICIALLRHYNLYFGGEYNQASYHDRYLFGVISIGGMLLVTIPIFIAHLFGSEIKPGLVGLEYALIQFIFKCQIDFQGSHLFDDGFRALFNGWYPVDRLLPHLQESTGQLECWTITWGINVQNNILANSFYINFDSILFDYFYRRCS